jgi:hypothetical protein
VIVALLLLLAQVDAPESHDFCTVVKSVVRTSVDGFKAVKGAKHEDSADKVSWTSPIKLPGSTICKVIEYKNGDAPFYACEMHATSCKLTEVKFLTLVKDVSTCLDAQPKMEDDGKKRTARLHKGGVPVRATFTRGADCQFRFFVEPLK